MLGLHIGRNQEPQSRRDLVRAEFEEGMEHMRQAAAHMAGGLNAGLGPGIGTARQMARDRTMYARGLMNNPRMMAAAGRARDVASRGRDVSMSAFSPIADAARAGMIRGHLDNDDSPSGAMSRLMFASSRRAAAAAEEPEGGHRSVYAMLAGGAALGAAGALVARRRTRTKWAEYEPEAISEDAEAFVGGAGATSAKDFSHHDTTMSRAKERAKGAYDNVRTRRQEHGHHHHEGEGHEGHEGHTHQAGGSAGGGPMGDDEVDRLIRSAKNGRM